MQTFLLLRLKRKVHLNTPSGEQGLFLQTGGGVNRTLLSPPDHTSPATWSSSAASCGLFRLKRLICCASDCKTVSTIGVWFFLWPFFLFLLLSF